MARLGFLEDIIYSVVEGDTVQLSVGVTDGYLAIELDTVIQIIPGTAEGTIVHS